MPSLAQIQDSLDASCKYLTSKQNQNGSWSDIESSEISRDSLYKQPIVATAQAIKALIFNLKPEYISRIQKAINYCNSVNTENINDSGILAWKLSGLSYSNVKIHNREAEKILETLITKQEPKGFWMEYPSTNYIVNYNVMESLKNHKIPNESKERFIKWMDSARAKDGGWGFTPNEDKGYITATTSSILSLLNAGKKASSEIFTELRTLLEQQQLEDGHWNAKFEEGHRNGEATAAAALCLMILSDDPFNKNVERAINYLLSIQTKDGHYSRNSIHPIRYINHLLSFYIYLKKEWKNTSLRKTIGNNQDVTNFYYQQFENELKSKLTRMSYQSILTSKVLGTTPRAIKRRLEIVRILDEKGTLSVAEIIDNLKEIEAYKNLKKKTHLTQIKSDVEYLKEINIIHEGTQGYYLGFKI